MVYLIGVGGAIVDLGCWPLLQEFCVCFLNVDLISGELFNIQNHMGENTCKTLSHMFSLQVFLYCSI